MITCEMSSRCTRDGFEITRVMFHESQEDEEPEGIDGDGFEVRV